MADLFDLLSRSGEALMAQQVGTQTTGNNINNVNSKGFHRQTTLLQAGAYGGVDPAIVTRVSDGLLNQQLGAQAGQAAFDHSHADGLTAIQTALGPLGDGGLNAAMADFFGAWRTLSATPGDPGVRASVLAQASSLTATLNRAATDVAQQQNQADAGVGSLAQTDNVHIAAIARLNGAILAAECSGQEASAMRDSRDTALQQLAHDLGATHAVDPQGTYTVFIGEGIGVVGGEHANLLSLVKDASTGLTHVEVADTTQGVVDARLSGGRMGGLLAVRDGDSARALQQLDGLARDLAAGINGVHAANVGLDGIGGRNLLQLPSTGNAARGLQVDPSLVGQPQALAAASSAAALPGDNTGALALVALQTQRIAVGNTLTLQDSAGSLSVGVGVATQAATEAQQRSASALAQITALVQNNSGVSIDEQMLQLSRYQNAFQAAAKVLTVVNQMLQRLQDI